LNAFRKILCVMVACTGAACASQPSPETVASLRAAILDLRETHGSAYAGADEYLARLEKLEQQPEPEAFAALQREALTANPLLNAQPLLYVTRRQYAPDHHNTETMFQTGEINTKSFAGGGALKLLDIRTGTVRAVLDAPDGIIRDPEVRFDGAAILFSMRRNIDDDYHVYEIAADGSGLRQLTRAAGVSDIDPFYLPDGDIAFSSTREPKFCMCNRHIMANLYRMEPDGANIHRIGKNTLFEGHGWLLPDGRILYNRWEYVDRNFGDAQGLWTVSPDGANHAVYWGNNTVSPGAVLDAKSTPGSEQVVCVFSSCHDRPWGAIALIDRRLALDGRKAVVRTWPPSAVDLMAVDSFDSYVPLSPKYEDPWPLSDKYFLCSRMTGDGERMGIYLLDVFGNELLLHFEEPGCFDPMPLAPRPVPPEIPSRRAFDKPSGTFYVADVYAGTHMRGVERGSVKYLRVVETPEKRFFTPGSWNGQGQEAPAMNWHDFNNKRILGTVPVEADGSACFEVPAERFVYFQLLDENGMMVQSMRSGTLVQPAEQTGCVGCHEHRLSSPGVGLKPPLALRRAASTLEGWLGPQRTFSYLNEVQPVFDRHCVTCHDYGKPAGEKLNLARDRDYVFNTSYNELWRKKYITVVGGGPTYTQQAKSWGSHASKLAAQIRGKHKDVALTDDEMTRVITWIDINAPYYPEYACAFPDNLTGRCPLGPDQVARLVALTGKDLAAMADHNNNRGPMISFERPELSPCLAGLRDKNPGAYHECLEIIRAGSQTLAARPADETSGLAPAGADEARQHKYVERARTEDAFREAIRTGGRMYDQ